MNRQQRRQRLQQPTGPVKVFVFNPDWTYTTRSATDLKTLQGLVGGYIEMLPPVSEAWSNFTVFANDSGRINGMPCNVPMSELYSKTLNGVSGPVLFLSENEEDPLSKDQLDLLMRVVKLFGLKKV